MKCGLGNWKDISEQYVRNKTPEECEDHYYTFYFKGKNDWKPTDDDFIIVSRSASSAASSNRGGSS
jgi:hypothetical protein